MFVHAIRSALVFVLSLAAGIAPSAALADGPVASSDLLIVLAADGRSHTVQHTLSSEGALLRLELPGSVIPRLVQFAGPERATFAEAQRRGPGRLALWSGSALVRYHHQYGEAVVREGERFTLSAPSVPAGLAIEDGTLARSRITWLFPENLELLAWGGEAESGRWSRENDMLTFESDGAETVALELVYAARAPEGTVPPPDPCRDAPPQSEACAPDTDADGVPDHRDLCLASELTDVPSAVAPAFGAAAATAAATTATVATAPTTAASDPLGCGSGAGAGGDPLVLAGIVFESGQSYLDAGARRLLDRVALALAHDPQSVYEIAAHTDNAGSAARNRRLSLKRADAVRHYLLLRGVDPNRLRARGHGEALPIRDNATPEGRRANRRVELERLD